MGEPFVYRFLFDDNYSESAAEEINRGYSHEKRKVSEFVEKSDYDALQAKLEKAMGALKKIASYDTLDGEKYISHEQGWHGVAEFASQALKDLQDGQ